MKATRPNPSPATVPESMGSFHSQLPLFNRIPIAARRAKKANGAITLKSINGTMILGWFQNLARARAVSRGSTQRIR